MLWSFFVWFVWILGGFSLILMLIDFFSSKQAAVELWYYSSDNTTIIKIGRISSSSLASYLSFTALQIFSSSINFFPAIIFQSNHAINSIIAPSLIYFLLILFFFRLLQGQKTLQILGFFPFLFFSLFKNSSRISSLDFYKIIQEAWKMSKLIEKEYIYY